MMQDAACRTLNDSEGNRNNTLSLVDKEPTFTPSKPIRQEHSSDNWEEEEKKEEELPTIPLDDELDGSFLDKSQDTVIGLVKNLEIQASNEALNFLMQQELQRIKTQAFELIANPQSENYAKLSELLQKIIKFDPKDWEAHYEMGILFWRDAQRQKQDKEYFSKAAKSFQKVAEITKNDNTLSHDKKKKINSAYIHLAQLYYNDINQLEHLLLLRPQPIYMCILLLIASYKHERYLRAILIASKIIYKNLEEISNKIIQKDSIEDLPYVVLIQSLVKLRHGDKKELEEGSRHFSNLLKHFASDITFLKCLSAALDILGEKQSFRELLNTETLQNLEKIPPRQQDMEEKLLVKYRELSFAAEEIVKHHRFFGSYKGKLLAVYEKMETDDFTLKF